MKKFICMILAVLSVLGLCACGEATNSAGVPMATKEPTEEERELIVDFYYAVQELESTDDALKQAELYREIRDMTEYDKYIGTEYASTAYLKKSKKGGSLFSTSYETDISTWDRHQILARFTLVEDVLLRVEKTEYDRVGNEEGPHTRAKWEYYADGKIKSISNEEFSVFLDLSSWNDSFLENDNGIREYDENGRLSKVTYGDMYGSIDMVCTYTYDANGNLAAMEAKNNYKERTYTYTCDNQGRTTAINWEADNRLRYEITYTYDAKGNLTEETKSAYNEKDVLEILWRYNHSYDETGKRTESTYLWQNIEDTHWSLNPDFVSDRYVQTDETATITYEYEGDKLVRATQVPGGETTYNIDGTVRDTYSDGTEKVVYTLVYDTFSIYNAPEA